MVEPLWRVRNHMVVTLTLLKFLLVAVLKGNFQSQLSTVAEDRKDFAMIGHREVMKLRAWNADNMLR